MDLGKKINEHGCDPDSDVIREYKNKLIQCRKR